MYARNGYLAGVDVLGDGGIRRVFLEIITVYKNLKGFKTKEIALEQMKLMATIQPMF